MKQPSFEIPPCGLFLLLNLEFLALLWSKGKYVLAWSNFKKKISRPLSTIIFRPKIIFLVKDSILRVKTTTTVVSQPYSELSKFTRFFLWNHNVPLLDISHLTDPMKETKIDLFYRGFSAQSSSIPSISCNSAAKPMASSKNSSNSSMGQAISSTSSSSPMISVIIT